MTGKSSILHKHTESSRGMRGAWKAGYEYISELRTKQTEDIPVFRLSRLRRVLHTLSCRSICRTEDGVYPFQACTYRGSQCELAVNIRW